MLYLQIKEEIKTAMKNKDTENRDVLKMVIDKAKAIVKEKNPTNVTEDIPDDVILQAIQKEVKQLNQTKDALQGKENTDLYASTTLKIKDYIKENNVSFVFECCDMENDPHIIEYPESKVVLLDVVKNQMKFEKLPYDELFQLATKLDIKVKEKAFVIESWEDFYAWYNEVTAEGYKYKGNDIEGFVIEDSVGYMTKLKLFYYKYWKKLRGVAQSVLRYGNYKWTGSLLTREENEFLGWCKSTFLNMTPEEKEAAKSYANICNLRKKFYLWKAEQEEANV